MFTMVTFLRGGISNPTPLAAFSQMPSGSKLIATVNNDADRQAVQSLGGTAVEVVPWDGQGGEWGRHQYVAGLWNRAIPMADTSFILLMDDDIIPGWNVIPVLTSGIQDSRFSAILCPYPYHESPASGVRMYPIFYTEAMIPLEERFIPPRREQIFTGGMGMSIFRKDPLQACLPVQIIDRFGSPSGTEYDVGLKFRDMAKPVHVDGRLRSKHITTT